MRFKLFVIFIPLLLISLALLFNTRSKINTINNTNTQATNQDTTTDATSVPETIDLSDITFPNTWKTTNRDDCGISLNYPVTWTLDEQNNNCMGGYSDGSGDWHGFCIKSPDFQGSLGAPVDKIDSGTVIQISCSASVAPDYFDINVALNTCLNDNKLHNSDNKCQFTKTKTLTWLQNYVGQYVTQKNDKYIQVLLMGDTPTELQVLASIK